MRKSPAPSRNSLLLRRRYAYLRAHRRCVQCTGRLLDGWTKARCGTCGVNNQAARDDARVRRIARSPGCQRCGLRGRHVCLPGIAAFAGIRHAVDVL